MIIDRITAIRIIPPKTVVRDVVVARPARDVVTACVVGSGERQISAGATGTILDVSYEELEIELYSPRDASIYAQRAQIEVA